MLVAEVYRFAVKIENLPFKDFLGYIGLSGEKMGKNKEQLLSVYICLELC